MEMYMWSNEEVKEVLVKIQDKASKDPEFRKRVLDNPSGVIAEISGKEIPEGFNVKFIENSPGVNQTIVLPEMIKEELTDEELDQVAGGRCRDKCLIDIDIC